MSKKVFKTLVASSLLVFSAFSVSSCIVMVPYGTQGQEGDVVESDITAINITNKEDLVAEWHAGDASRKIEATLEGVEMGLLNATIQGYVVIESSAPEIVEVSGLNLIAKAEGNAVITLRASKCSTFIALKIEPAINNTMKLADIKSKIVAGELKDKDSVEFNGYITGLINKSEDQLYNGVWVQDGDAAIQLYAGNITDVFKATPDIFTIGNKVHVKGTLSPYNGLNEVKPTEISLVEDDTLIAPTTLALTGDNFNADDLAGKDGQLVSAAKLIYAGADHPVVSDTVAAKKHTTLNFKLEKSDKSLVDCDVYINYHIGDEALGALKAIAANLVTGDIVSVDGLLSWYNKPQITFGELANGKKPGDCMVITGEKYTFADPESITITSKDDATKVLVGKTLQLTASVLPVNAVQTVTWSSNDTDVATVSEKGLVKGVKAGEVTITATSTAKADVKQEFVLSVEEEEKPEYGPQLVTGAPEVGKEYIMGLVHEKNEETYYLTGAMSSYYYATSTDYNEAGKIGFVAVDGGFNMTMTTAAGTQYMNIKKNDTHINVLYEDAPSSVWVYNADNNAMTTDVEGTTYFLGTSNTGTYKTLSACSDFEKAFVGRLYMVAEPTPAPAEDGSEANPYSVTVAEAIAATPSSGQTDAYYKVTGYVVLRDGSSNTYIADENVAPTSIDKTKLFEIYNYNGDNKGSVEIGAKVEVVAKLKSYKQLAETATISSVTVLEPGHTDEEVTATVAQAIEAGNALVDTTTSNGFYKVSGYMVNDPTENKGKYSFDITDDGQATSPKLNIYGLSLSSEDLLKYTTGTHIEIEGYLKKYGSTIEITEGFNLKVIEEEKTQTGIVASADKSEVKKDGIVTVSAEAKYDIGANTPIAASELAFTVLAGEAAVINNNDGTFKALEVTEDTTVQVQVAHGNFTDLVSFTVKKYEQEPEPQTLTTTYTFNTSSADTSSSVSSLNSNHYTLGTGESDIVSSWTTASCYPNSISGLKFGTGSKAGSITATFGTSYTVSSVSVAMKRWVGTGEPDSTVVVFNGEDITLTDELTAYEADVTNNTFSVAAKTASKQRYYISSITFTYTAA